MEKIKKTILEKLIKAGYWEKSALEIYNEAKKISEQNRPNYFFHRGIKNYEKLLKK